jgi:3-hydroxyacyl-CoA dehydrogenase/enoyl-CoA hydratase/3-hydroxybutyryl-CoA epimerase
MALALMAETVALPLDRAFAREARAASRLIIGRDVRAMLHSQHFSDRAERRMPSGVGEFESAAILGAGETGSDIAHRLASTGTAVRIHDVRREAVREGVARARDRLDWERDHERITEQQARRRSARLGGGTGFGGFGTLDLLVAAADAAEREAQELLVEAETHVRDDCLLGFHDWVTSPSEIQRTLHHPERVIGLAPSFPIDQFALLEIVPGTLTSPDAVSLARRLARRLSLVPVVVSDQTPTPGTRLLAAYLAEAGRLLEEGIPIEHIDEAAVDFGYEVGPFHRADAIGSARACRLLERVAAKLGGRMAASSRFTRIGSEGGTFYRYRGGRPSGANSSLPDGDASPSTEVTEMIQRRLLLLLVNEAARIVEEGGVMDPGDLEVIALYGLGFPRQRGGLLFHAQTVGLVSVVEDLATEARQRGDRFAPAGVLRDLAFTGRGFFDTDPEPPGHGLDAVLQ